MESNGSIEIPLPRWTEPGSLESAMKNIWRLGRSMHEHAYLLGKCLIWVKDEVGHGNFLPWLEGKVWFSERTAERMMTFAGRCERAGFLVEYHPRKFDTVANLDPGPLPPGKYRVIYADPPWGYGDKRLGLPEYGPAAGHYPTMTVEQICALPIAALAADNAVLFLWVPVPLLPDCFPVIDAWGFEYKSLIVWDKRRHNYGHYISVRCELVPICTKGSCLPDGGRLFDNVITIQRSNRHSEKPRFVRKMIDKMYLRHNGRNDRIELFAREKLPPWWDSWGNEARRAS